MLLGKHLQYALRCCVWPTWLSGRRRGELEVGGDAVGRDGRVADAYLSVRGWTMGLAFVNGFNLGWYWPERGPANTMCAPSLLGLGIEVFTIKP